MPINKGFWSSERLEKEHYRFQCVATRFGKSPKKDPLDNSDLYLEGYDYDGLEGGKLLISKIDNKRNLVEKTFFVQTYKGLHKYCLSYKQHAPLKGTHCKPGFEIEIKTNFAAGMMTLPNSTHR